MIDLQAMQPWLERETSATDGVSGPLVARLAALMDQPSRAWAAGETVPASWYVTLFGPVERQSSLGPDGHPPKGELLPPIPWPRRMFAGRRVEFAGELRVGDPIERRSRVTSIVPKQGRNGPMCFVTLRHELHTPRGLAVVEEQDVVYRPAVDAAADADARANVESTKPAPAASAASVGADADAGTSRGSERHAEFQRTVVPDTTLLFRYSAITFNAHRIHYDADYARQVEGYPALVVNGGLSTLLLWQLAEQSLDMRLRRSTTRNLQPLFVDQPLTLSVAAPQDGRVQAWVRNARGETAIEATLELS